MKPNSPSSTAASSNERSGSGGADKVSSNEESKPTSTTGSFECNICLDAPQDAVVSMCGHLFCWSCIHRWIESRPVCPVCKAAVSVEKIIPLYGRGGDHTRDPRSKIPPRPAGQRVEPEQNSFGTNGLFGNFFGGADSGNFRMSVGIGAFPLGFLATAFSFGVGPANRNANSQNNWTTDNEMLSKLCFCLAVFFVGWLLIA